MRAVPSQVRMDSLDESIHAPQYLPAAGYQITSPLHKLLVPEFQLGRIITSIAKHAQKCVSLSQNVAVFTEVSTVVCVNLADSGI
jgi:hypothetical protein